MQAADQVTMGEGFELCSSARCVLTGPMFWAAVTLLRVYGSGDLRRDSFSTQEGVGRSGVCKYCVCSVGAYGDSYQHRRIVWRAGAMN